MAISLYRQEDAAVLTLDGVLLLGHRPQVRLTEHPIEDGTSVVDHAVRVPLSLTVTGVVTETPYAPTEAYIQLTGAARLQAARQWLDESVGKLITVTGSRLGDYRDLLLQAWPHDEGQVGSLTIDIRLRQATFAEVLSVDVTPAAVAGTPGAATEDNLGQQATTAATATATDQSILASILGL